MAERLYGFKSRPSHYLEIRWVGRQGRRKLRNLGVVLSILAGVIVVGGLLLWVVVYQRFKLPSGSMLPTFTPGQHLLVNKLANEARRGSAVVFESPESPDHRFVKRVIGRPGDRLEVVGGRPIINGWLVPRCEVGPLTLPHGAAGTVFLEYLGDRSYLVLHEPSQGPPCTKDADCSDDAICSAERCGQRQGPWAVPAGEVWMLGDNRDNSHDSRSYADGRGGGVPLDHVIGSVVGTATPELPAAAAPAERAALATCLANRPAQTSP